MQNRRTEHSDTVHTLPGGNEDNDLWAYSIQDNKNNEIIASVWVPTEEEREKIANGWNIRLLVWAKRTPPVAVDITDEKIGKAKPESEFDGTDLEGGPT